MSLKSARRVTMRDIAQKTGFTVNTVSHALKDKPDISAKTRAEIQRVAREMGYVRNTVASALRSGKSHTLALILGELGNPKFAAMANDIEEAARERQYSVIILCTHEDAELEQKAVQTALERQVDGIIINPTQRSDACIAQMQNAIPFVLIERRFEGGMADSVVCDEEEGGYLAGRHLIEMGHTKIVHLCGPEYIHSGRARRLGFLRAAAQTPAESAEVLPVGSPEENAENLHRMAGQGFTGAFFFSDLALLETIAYFEEKDPAFLRQMAFVGYDNIHGKFAFPAPVCSIDPSSTRLCRATVDLLLRRIGGEAGPPQELVIPVKMVCRNSCRPARTPRGGELVF